MTRELIRFKHLSGLTIDLELSSLSPIPFQKFVTRCLETLLSSPADSTNWQTSLSSSTSSMIRLRKRSDPNGTDSGSSDPNSLAIVGELAKVVSLSLEPSSVEWASSSLKSRLRSLLSTALNGWSIVGESGSPGTSEEWSTPGTTITGPTPEKNPEPAPSTEDALSPSFAKPTPPSPTSDPTTPTTDIDLLSARVRSLESCLKALLPMLETIAYWAELRRYSDEGRIPNGGISALRSELLSRLDVLRESLG